MNTTVDKTFLDLCREAGYETTDYQDQAFVVQDPHTGIVASFAYGSANNLLKLANTASKFGIQVGHLLTPELLEVKNEEPKELKIELSGSIEEVTLDELEDYVPSHRRYEMERTARQSPYYNVVDKDTGDRMNVKALRKADAEELLESLLNS